MLDKQSVSLVVLGLLIFVGLVAFVWIDNFTQRGSSPVASDQNLENFARNRSFQTVKLGEHELEVILAESASQHQQGLSGRADIGADGMLFVFSRPNQPIFWMKDMQFALDFLWIADGQVVDMHKNVPPPQTPSDAIQTVQPGVAVDFVLEVPAGFIDRMGITMGTPLALTGKAVDKTWESSKLLQE